MIIEEKDGNVTKIKIVPDNYKKEDEDFSCKDISVNGGCLPLICKKDFDRIFGEKKCGTEEK